MEKNLNDLRAAQAAARKAWEATVAKDEKFDKAIRELVTATDPKTKADRDGKLKKHFN